MTELAIILVVVTAVALVSRWYGAQQTPTLGLTGRAGADRGFQTLPRRLWLREFRNVILADRRGTTEVDVIVVGNNGVFVVELKNYNAYIFGEEADEKWTARYVDGSSHQFQNPLRQNFRHVMAVQEQLGLSPEVVQSVVSFTGDCEFMRPMPPNVVRGSYRRMIEDMRRILLTDAQVHSICSSLESLEAASTAAAFDGHIVQLRARYSSTTTCPKCGNNLVIRHSRNAPADDIGFLGCRGYPRCRYTRKIDST